MLFATKRIQNPIILTRRFITAVIFFAVSFSQAELVITMSGDINFNSNRQSVHPIGVASRKGQTPWSEFTAGITPLLNGDLNFGNIETVVTDRNDLGVVEKAFNFKSHPNAIEHLTQIGFNLFSLANNHSYDYGFEGMNETLKHMARIQENSPAIHFSGIGENLDDAARPVVFKAGKYRIAFIAISILDTKFRAGKDSFGMISFRSNSDYNAALANLRQTQADFKIISIHYGTEKQITLDAGQRERYHQAILKGDADLVIGHHPHVVRPVEMVNGRVIFYSLGNALMLGAANLDAEPVGSDMGLLGRLYLEWDNSNNRLRAQAIEAIPLKGMHYKPRPLSASEAYPRIQHLNELSRSEVGDGAVIFKTKANGIGVACAEGANLAPRTAAACR